ncbi:MAG: transglutaminase N-terminal domain-containing protein [Verrucomicrobiales bacterium]
MRYHIVHRTLYTYESAVTVSHHVARLGPRALPHQTCPWHDVDIVPEPVARVARLDAYGNQVVYFEQAVAHTQLEVMARSYVEVGATPAADPSGTPRWEDMAEATRGDGAAGAVMATEFRFGSPLVGPDAALEAYTRPSFWPGRPLLEAAAELNHRIHADFAFDPVATDVATPVLEAFAKRRGVCQDFAHIMIGCLRSMGLPARYVSGYIETVAPPGQEKLVGADASHAWVSLFCGDALGWIDLDPTNDFLPGDRHVTIAWGRDFLDVSPLRGVTWAAGEQRLLVEVDVKRIE